MPVKTLHRTVLPCPGFTLRETRYDLAAAGLLATAVAAVGICLSLMAVWLMVRGEPEQIIGDPDSGQIQPAEFDVSDGLPEPIVVESPIAENTVQMTEEKSQGLASAAEVFRTLAPVVAAQPLAEDSAPQGVLETAGSQALGTTGTSTGRSSRGIVPAEQRWLIQFDQQLTAGQYAAWLDQFDIELCAILPNGRMAYLSELSGDRVHRDEPASNGDTRLITEWADGQLQQLDRQFFEQAGIDVSAAVIVHRFSPQTEQLLEELEQAYQGLATENVRRTWFSVRRTGDQFEFRVIRQNRR